MSKNNFKRNFNQTEPKKEEDVQIISEVGGVEVPEEVIKQPEPAAPLIGFVSGCTKLNIRSNPREDASILTVINKDAPVKVNESESTKHWFNVKLENGVEGFCMVKFITFKK